MVRHCQQIYFFFGFYLFTICVVSEWIITTSMCACSVWSQKKKTIWFVSSGYGKLNNAIVNKSIFMLVDRVSVLKPPISIMTSSRLCDAVPHPFSYQRYRRTPLDKSQPWVVHFAFGQMLTKSKRTHTHLSTEWVSELVRQCLLMPIAHDTYHIK